MSQPEGHVYIFQVQSPEDGSTITYVSPRSPEEGVARGLRSEEVMGRLADADGELTAENFEANPEFLPFVNWVIGKHCRDWPGLRAEAERQQEGWVYIVDARTPDPKGEVPPEDVIGAVRIEKGELVEYRGSPDYRMFTQNGFMQLSPWLKEKWLEELQALPPLA